MKQILQVFISILIILGCNSKEHKDSNFEVPEMFYTNYKNSNTQKANFNLKAKHLKALTTDKNLKVF